MRGRGLLLGVGLLGLFGLSGGAAPAEAEVIATVNQSTLTSSVTQLGRISRGGPTSSCAAPTTAPSVIDDPARFRYRNHTFRSSLTNPVCVEVDISSTCADLFSVGYLGTFDPENPRTRYAADMGDSLGSPTYSFTVPGGSFFSVVVHETVVSSPCGAYTVTFRSRGPWATALPSIAGRPSVGAVLTGTNAAWLGTPVVQRHWLRCDAAGANCSAIPGATGATYTVTDADLGYTLRFRNDATDADATNSTDSDFVEPFIPFETRDAESLTPGDRAQNGIFGRNAVESRCGVPTSAPTILQPTSVFLYDAFLVRSLLNESVCLAVHTDPACVSGVTPAVYNPAFSPAAGLAANYAGNSGVAFVNNGAVSAILPGGGSREVTVSHGSSAGSCASYSLVLGADAPFASARPAIGGSPVEGGTLTASDGAWSGTPAIGRSWLRCDAAGAACVPIPGATGATYSPIAADAGQRLRLRVTATQGRAVSSDSEPSGLVAAAPPLALDRRAPRVSVRLASRNLRKAVKSGRIPIRVSCDERCTAVVELRLTRRLAKRLKLKRVVIARVRGAVRAGRATILRAKLTRRARRALRTRRSLKLSIAASFTDAAGNRARVARKGALRRPANRPRRS